MVIVDNAGIMKLIQHAWPKRGVKVYLKTRRTKMTFQQLARVITLEEGKKESISNAQVMEVLKLLSIKCVEEPEVVICLLQNGIKAKKKKK